MEQHPHVWIQLSLDAPCIPGRGGEQEKSPLSKSSGCVFSAIISSISQPGVMLFKEIDQRIHHVLRVTASRGKDDMEDSTLNVVRDSLGGIGGVVQELPPLSTSDRLHLPRSSSTVPGWPTLTRPGLFIGSFSSDSPHTHHRGRYTLVPACACSEALPFVAPCPREANPAIPPA